MRKTPSEQVERVARLYRHNDEAAAALDNPNRSANLLLDPDIGRPLARDHAHWSKTAGTAMTLGIAVPAMAGALTYFDALRSGRLPSNLIQAQRDLFGAHGFRRTDAEGTFHAAWAAPKRSRATET